jgi:hypothetical protein
MSIFDFAASLMGMDDDIWMRHANPASGWSRILTFPFTVAALYSRKWLGWWFLVPVVLVGLWTWLNPRIFPRAKSTRNWASKGVLGEKIFTARRKNKESLPSHHAMAANITTTIAALGGIIFIYGVIVLQTWPTLLGAVIGFLGKVWFVDRMVWLFEDMKHLPEYQELDY